MHIVNHKLSGVPFVAAQSAGRAMKPELVILHDTAGRLDKGNSVNWFTNPDCNVSAHIVVERDGSITQLVAFNQQAFHAGKSEYKGRSGCNAFAIGVEIVHPGICDKDGRAWFHKKTEPGFGGLKHVKTPQHGDGFWMEYTPEQIAAVTELCRALVVAYPEIKDISAHFIVSPGRKVDVSPLFPLDAVRQAVFGPQPVAALAPVTVPVPPPVVETHTLTVAQLPSQSHSPIPPASPPPPASVAPTPVTPAAAHAEVHAQLRQEDWFYNLRRGLLKQLGIGTGAAGGASLFASAFDDPVATGMAVLQFAKTHPLWIGGGVLAVVMAIELRDFILRERAIQAKELQQ